MRIGKSPLKNGRTDENMRTWDEIAEKAGGRIFISQVGGDGGAGIISMPGWKGSLVWSYDGGWDHVSVAPSKRRIMPSWEDMCMIKDIFFREDEAVIQIHPPKSEYVNNVPNCLHLWKSHEKMPLPPSWMVGVKDGESMAEVYAKAEKELRGDNKIPG